MRVSELISKLEKTITKYGDRKLITDKGMPIMFVDFVLDGTNYIVLEISDK